jgi:DNA-binding PadR family transcriptional regulator
MDAMLVTNLKNELRRGTQVLAVLSLLNHSSYGYSLLQSLEEKGVAVEAGTLYPLLRRLDAQGLLKSEWDTSDNRPRKYYVLSEEGMKMYQILKDEWKQIVSEIQGILEV